MIAEGLKKISLLLSFTLLLAACVEQPEIPVPVPDPEITLGAKDGHYGFEKGSDVVSFSITDPVAGEKVQVKSDASWVRVSDVGKFSFGFNYDENTEYSDRTAVLTVSYGKAKPVTFTAHQQAAPVPDPVITPEMTEISVGNTAGSGSFTVAVENPTTALLQARSDADWLAVEVTSSNGWVVKYSYDANGNEYERTATITLSYGAAEAKTVTLGQEKAQPEPPTPPTPPTPPAPVIELDNTTVNFGGYGGSTSFGFTVQNPIDGKKIAVTTDSPGWVMIDYIYEYNIQFSVFPNPDQSKRQANIFFDYEGASRQILVVNQEAAAPNPEVVLASESIEVVPSAGNYSFSFKVNNPILGQDATVYSNTSDWITVTGYGNTKVEFSVAENTGTKDRQGTISVHYPNAQTRTFVVTQKGVVPQSEIIVENTEISLESQAGSYAFPFSIVNPSGDNLSATSSQSWLRVEVLNYGLTVKYNYDANPTDTERKAVVTLKYGNATDKIVTFSQKAKAKAPEIVLEKSTLQVSGQAGGFPVAFKITNPVFGVNATAKADCDWVTVDSVGGSDILLSVTENNTGNLRKATVTVSYSGAADQKFDIIQDAYFVKPVLSPSPLNYTLSPASHVIMLMCSVEHPVPNEQISVSYDEVSWVSVEAVADNRMKLTIKENTTDASRTFNFVWKYPNADDVIVPVVQKADETVRFALESDSVVIDKFGTGVIVPYTIKNAPAALQYFTYDKPSWLNIGYNQNENYFIFGAGENKTGAERTAQVTFHAWFSGGVTITTTVNVSQSAQDLKLTLNPSSATRDYKAGTVTASVTLGGGGSGTVHFSSTGGWVSLSNYSATGLTLAYDQNNSKSDRTATITITYPNHAPATFTLTQKGNPAFPDGVVDLGLASGLLWATANIGAGTPTAAGNFYAWGETATKSSYSWSNYAFGTENALTRYTDNSYQLGSGDDIAAKTLGKGWRMPTNIDWLELEEACVITETTVNGVSGLTATSRKTGQNIFLPYTGYKDGSTIKSASTCYLWAASRPHLYPADQKNGLSFYGEGCTAMPRYVGMPVRAVFDPSK